MIPWTTRLHQWWQADRIRIAPSEGRLWALSPPCILTIQGQNYQISKRQQAKDHAQVIYSCQGKHGCKTLSITGQPGHRPQLHWQGQAISEEDIEYWG